MMNGGRQDTLSLTVLTAQIVTLSVKSNVTLPMFLLTPKSLMIHGKSR